MEEGCCPLYMGSRRCPSETEGEGGALFAFYDMFFLLYSQTALQIAKLPFKWLNCPYLLRLTSIREVTCVTHGSYLFQLREVSRRLLKDGSRRGKIAPRHYISRSAEEVCLDSTCK